MSRMKRSWTVLIVGLLAVAAILSLFVAPGPRPISRESQAQESLYMSEQLAQSCVLYATLHKEHSLPPHFASLFFDPTIRGSSVSLPLGNLGPPRFHTDWTVE